MSGTCAAVPKTTIGTQVPPSWLWGGSTRRTGWVDITICKMCERTGYRYDCAPSSPCSECGTRGREGIGRWNPPVVASWWWHALWRGGWTDKRPFDREGFWEVKP